MEAVLIDRLEAWLGGADALRTIDEASVAVAREEVRRRGAAVGLDGEACERLAGATSELAHNQLRHARDGVIGLRAIARGGVPGLEVIAADRGPGIADPTSAMRGTGGRGLGVGLSAAYRLADELDADVRAGEGTCVWLRVFAQQLGKSAVAIVGRALAGETASGDDATFVRSDDAVIAGLIDGVGHGEAAQEAANAAAAELRARAADPIDETLGAIDHALEGGRGAVMAIARVDHVTRVLEHAGAGNITARLVHRDGTVVHLAGVSRSLGLRQRARRLLVDRSDASDLLALVMYTDGLSSRIDLAAARDLLREPPLIAAHQLLLRHARPDDDATVLVLR